MNAAAAGSALYLGLMSGTSLDGVDGVVLDLREGAPPRVLGHAQAPFPLDLRAEFLALNRSGPDELHRGQIAAQQLARVYAEVVGELLRECGLQPSDVAAIGAHGQTVRHRPECGYTVQLNAPALLAELSSITVVADFRSRDIAAGGQGAPLVPAFHRAVFAVAGRDAAVLNLGGIANLSLLHADGRTLGFDCGPGNVLLDLWAQEHLGQAFDAEGRWAQGGRVLDSLLEHLLREPYFAAPAPKSTGRDLFHAQWLQRALGAHGGAQPRDVQATLAELSARSIAQALRRDMPQVQQLLVCGGGVRNADLLRRLRAALPGVAIEATDARGLPAQQVEAAAFAWLAALTLAGQPGNLPAVTGAAGTRVLGAIYPV